MSFCSLNVLFSGMCTFSERIYLRENKELEMMHWAGKTYHLTGRFVWVTLLISWHHFVLSMVKFCQLKAKVKILFQYFQFSLPSYIFLLHRITASFLFLYFVTASSELVLKWFNKLICLEVQMWWTLLKLWTLCTYISWQIYLQPISSSNTL